MTAAKTRTPRRASARPRVTTARQHPQGIVKAIVAVTGVEDEVGDIIVPGIFTSALAKRKPKVVFHHDMKDFAGRIVHIEEWLPGDARLPDKQPNGQPWPKDAGALVATMEFNLRTARGAEIYEWARFYAETGEAAWSIGYVVPPGMSAKRAGIRYIYGIDLFEVSLVLHGAHPMTMALEVKSAAAAVDRARAAMEYKESPLGALPATDEHVNDVMVALYPDSATAQSLAVKGGERPEDLHVTLAYLGMADELDATPEDLVAAVKGALTGHGPLSGQVGGIGVFPGESSGTPVWAPVDVPGLEKVREAVVDALEAGPAAGKVARDHGYTPHMTLGYDLPSISPVGATPVQFGEVVVVYGHDRYPVPIGAPAATGAPALETKAAHRAVAAARAATPPMEVKSMHNLPGSYEERQRLLDRALTKKFIKKKDRGDDAGGVACDSSWVNIEATFDDHVIVTVHDKDGARPSYTVPYTWDGDEVDLADPVEVELAVVPVGAGEAPPVPDAVQRALTPTLTRIAAAATALDALPIEAKQYPELRPPLLKLIDALYAKGVDVAGMALGEDEDDDDLDLPDTPADVAAPPAAEAAPLAPEPGSDEDLDALDGQGEPIDPGLEPGDLDAPAGEPDDELGDEPDDDDAEDRVYVDPEEIRRELAELRA